MTGAWYRGVVEINAKAHIGVKFDMYLGSFSSSFETTATKEIITKCVSQRHREASGLL